MQEMVVVSAILSEKLMAFHFLLVFCNQSRCNDNPLKVRIMIMIPRRKGKSWSVPRQIDLNLDFGMSFF